MRLRKKYSRGAIAMAMLHGFLMGIGGVLLFGFIVMSEDGESGGAEATKSGETVPADAQPAKEEAKKGEGEEATGNRKTMFFAIQHGMFSSYDAASGFLSSQAQLDKAAIVRVADKFYLWSAIHLTDSEARASVVKDTFVKPFTVDAAACPAETSGKLPVLLAGQDAAKFKFDDKTKDDALPEGWKKNVSAVQGITEDPAIMRLHLVSQYAEAAECLKIEF
ncbi:hypothetical protein AV656_01620 [Bhargavaea cecembensis]|uniref:Uncharacterized protein n=1 Tax=Bhargavaea cecembensis TaxID=394098 RepID=A0A161SP60_9BACL|nr:hypothetical protein [Bhargavaea cecembensis]KZE40003.1 hypothetical protein AV656_01620 [Bhargavaea cecembensis]